MNDKKICFVTCVNDDRQYEECVKYIQSLEIPEGHEVELISVKQATSIFNGYNEAMRSSDAKYKVYLHQDVFILNRSFIVDVLKLFHENTDLGLLGVVGAKTLPANGLWWESNETFGKVYDSQTGNMQLIEFKTAQSDYESVMAIDGLIMATQYDLPWREDIFTEWNFYDVSQSLEFLKAGYEVGVPGQKQPWCLHDNGVENVRSGYEENRLIFVEQYHKQFQPLVSVLIPTYNRPQYLKLALESVLGQTYKNIEIIISDDSTNFDTQEMVRTFTEKNTNIRYLKNEENLGQFINDLKLFDLAEGEYINFLMDDDLFHPQKIEKMMKYFLADTKEEITIVTSHRKLIDDLGNELPDIPVTQRLSDKDIISDGILFGDFILARNFNRIGEPTTPLFRKKALKEPFGMFGGRKYGCNVDVATWANLLAEGKIVFIAETLSYFRIHHGQQLHSHKMIIQGTADYAHIILEAPKKGFFKDFNVYRDAVQNCINYVSYILTKYAHGNNAGLESELDEVNVNLISLKELHIKLNEQLPLVSVLIPAYNRPHYLKLALQSVLDQTYKNIEIIICDDSTNDEVKDMITPFLVDNTKIHYYKNEKNLFVENWHKCLNLANGDYINYLMDDDLFHPQKIEKMMNYFLADKKEEITIVTSYRKVVDDLGNEMPDIPATQRLFEQDTVMDGIVLGNYMLISRANVVGEPTTAMFRRKDLIEKFGIYKGKQYSAINDLATWISLLSRGKVVYISEVLSYFRQHAGQNQKSLPMLFPLFHQWPDLIMDSRKDGFLNSEIDYKLALNNYLKQCTQILDMVINQKANINLEPGIIEEAIRRCVKEIVEYQDQYYCSFCNNHFQQFDPWPDIYDFPKYQFEMWNQKTAICPSCKSTDRERLYKFYIERETNLLSTYQKLLHIAPEQNLRNWLLNIKNISYTCGDLYPRDKQTERIDVTQISYPDNHFDVLICSHVLEHINDDRTAMKELHRVLKTGGWGILQVPISVSIEETFEDFSVTTPEARQRIFGQDDHVRIYAKDYFKRLESVGFVVKPFNIAEKYSLSEARKYGLSQNDNLYVVFKG